MRNLKYIFIFLLFGCSSSKVIYDYNLKTDFSKFKTYHFFEDAGNGLNELDVKRFTSAIDKNLDSLGLKKTEKPDFYINVISEKNETPNNNNVGVGLGGGRGGVSISTGIFFGGNKINEKIIIDFVESTNNELFWQGKLNIRVKEKIKPEQRIKIVRQVVQKILSKYPPSE